MTTYTFTSTSRSESSTRNHFVLSGNGGILLNSENIASKNSLNNSGSLDSIKDTLAYVKSILKNLNR